MALEMLARCSRDSVIEQASSHYTGQEVEKGRYKKGAGKDIGLKMAPSDLLLPHALAFTSPQ